MRGLRYIETKHSKASLSLRSVFQIFQPSSKSLYRYDISAFCKLFTRYL